MALVMAAVVLPPEPLIAQVSVSASFDAYSLQGQAMVTGGPGEVAAVRSRPCGAIHADIAQYNKDEGRTTHVAAIPTIGTSEDQFDLLRDYFTPADGSPTTFTFAKDDLDFCTEVQKDGWQPATAQVLGWAESESIRVTVTLVGPVACTSPGQVLLVQSGYYYSVDEWKFFYGTDWAEDFLNAGPPVYTGILNTVCLDLIPGGPSDFLEVAEAVPSAQVNYNPTIRGLTGLATWLWYDFSAQGSYLLELSIKDVPARGTTWDFNMSAWVDRVAWDIDCETPCDYRGTEVDFDDRGYEYTLDLEDVFDPTGDPPAMGPAAEYEGGAASDNDAAASHLYRTKGDYVLSTATVWRAAYDLLGLIYPYDPVVVADSVDYQVIEVRSRLVTPTP